MSSSTEIPKHVAIIMDGNRRWARKRFLPAIAGHWAGASALKQIVEAACDLGLQTLTVYAFSTENWQRSQLEVDTLFKVLQTYLLKERSEMRKEGVRLQTIGDLSKFPGEIMKVINETKEFTSSGKKLDLVLALNYGSRNEITRAVKALIDDCAQDKVKSDSITEEVFAKYLDTSKYLDPALLIRTSGEMRLSNFMLWQISYAEVYVTEVLWPDFTKGHFLEAIKEYQRREKRLGT